MKDRQSHKTDLLDSDDGLDRSIDFGRITDLQGASIVLDLLGNWQTPESDDSPGTAHAPEFVNNSSLFDRFLEPLTDDAGCVNTPTYVPEKGLVGSLFAESVQSQGTFNAPVDRLRLPELGSELFGFRLLHVLGAGSFAKVFLARQGDLANRPVVLKVSAIEGTEPQTLAQLQHTNVVPIYSVHEDHDAGLRAVCMPYYGGAALSKVLYDLWNATELPASGKNLVDALDRTAGPDPTPRTNKTAPLPGQDATSQLSAHTARNTIAQMTYVQAVAWVVGRVAEGLNHSHERNIIHRDVKPSNILLNAEAQPLLLDFNVSQLVDCDPHDASLGGTIAYMAPEHLRAAIARDTASMMLVDHRSDVYSLGLVLYEMLTGSSPFDNFTGATVSPDYLATILTQREGVVPSLKQNAKLDIPWTLESIVRKSLAPEPADRYQTAGQMSEDLNRFLNDQPLLFAPELSRVERVQKWMRRHPRFKATALVTLLALGLIIPGGIALSMTRSSLATNVEELNRASALHQANDFKKQTIGALSSIKTVSPDQDTLRVGIVECRKTLRLFGVLDQPRWQQQGHWKYFSFGQRRALGENVRELLLVLAGAEFKVSRDKGAGVAQALKLLSIAENIESLPPSRALLIERARYLTLNQQEALAAQVMQQAEHTPAETAYDKYLLASALTRQGTAEGLYKAIQLLTEAIKLNRTHYWSHFERALCHQELGEYFLAASDLGTCVGLWPESCWAHFNLGCLLDQQGRQAEAVGAYTAAINFSRDFTSAYFNRGLALLELREYERALSDFQKTRALGRDDAVLDACRAMALEGLGQSAEADQEFAAAMQRAQKIPGSPIERISWTYAFAVAHRAPQISQQIFDDILKSKPTHPQALYGQGMLEMARGHLESAERSFTAALNADPRFLEPMRFRAISLARRGLLEEAAVDADMCVTQEPTNPETFYTAACVAALSARRTGGQQIFIDHALDMLQRALVYVPMKHRESFLQRATQDDDLSVLRGDALFQELTGNVADQSKTLKPHDI